LAKKLKAEKENKEERKKSKTITNKRAQTSKKQKVVVSSPDAKILRSTGLTKEE